MSATTMAVATRTETVDPPAVRSPGHAALPVSDAVISVHAWGACHARDFSSCKLALCNSSNVNNDLNRANESVTLYLRRAPLPLQYLRHCEKKMAVPQSGHDFVFSGAFRDGEAFPEA